MRGEMLLLLVCLCIFNCIMVRWGFGVGDWGIGYRVGWGIGYGYWIWVLDVGIGYVYWKMRGRQINYKKAAKWVCTPKVEFRFQNLTQLALFY